MITKFDDVIYDDVFSRPPTRLSEPVITKAVLEAGVAALQQQTFGARPDAVVSAVFRAMSAAR
jgi:hypothetical protein